MTRGHSRDCARPSGGGSRLSHHAHHVLLLAACGDLLRTLRGDRPTLGCISTRGLRWPPPIKRSPMSAASMTPGL